MVVAYFAIYAWANWSLLFAVGRKIPRVTVTGFLGDIADSVITAFRRRRPSSRAHRRGRRGFLAAVIPCPSIFAIADANARGLVRALETFAMCTAVVGALEGPLAFKAFPATSTVAPVLVHREVATMT